MSKAHVEIDPEVMRLQAFTIEIAATVFENAIKQLSPGTVVMLGPRPAGDILRDLTATMRAGAVNAENDFKSRLQKKDERQQRGGRVKRAGTKGNGGQQFAFDDEFPGAKEFNQGTVVDAGGGQMPPMPMMPQAQVFPVPSVGVPQPIPAIPVGIPQPPIMPPMPPVSAAPPMMPPVGVAPPTMQLPVSQPMLVMQPPTPPMMQPPAMQPPQPMPVMPPANVPPAQVQADPNMVNKEFNG